MIVNKYFFIGLHLLVTYHAVKTFVILSANVDDVKKIAKEFSGPLTDEIVGLILKATKNYTYNTTHDDETRSFKSNLNIPLNLKYKNIIRNRKEPIQPVNYHNDDTHARGTPKYSYHVAPKIHNYAEVRTETQRTYSTPKRYNVVSLSSNVSPPLLMKKISIETFEPEKIHNDDLKREPKISSQVLNELIKYQIDQQNKIATPQVPKISSKISDDPKLFNNVDLNHITPSQLPTISSKEIREPKKHNDDDFNNTDVQKETTKKRDTSTKLIEMFSNEESDEETNKDFQKTKASSKKRKKKATTMQSKEIKNQEITAKTSLETEVSIKTKTKKYKAVPVTIPTTNHNDVTTVDLELQKFEKEVRSYLTSKSSTKTTSVATSQKITENTNSHHKNDKHKHSKSKKHKKHNRKHERTKASTLNLVRLVEKVERLDQVAKNIMSSTTTKTTTPATTAKKIISTRPTPAYPKQEEYKIPDSEFKLSYDPNEKTDLQDYNLMYGQYFKRNQMIKQPEDNAHNPNTVGQLSEVIQKIIKSRLDSKLVEKTMTEHSSRRQYIPNRSTEIRNMRGLLTNSEEEAMLKIIKAMIDSKKINDLKSPRYGKEQKRSEIKAFNIHKMSPEENMADVIQKMLDSSLKMQFEKPQMSVSALAETLKNKYYENNIESGNKKVSEMIEKIIEKKIQEYAQTTTKIVHSKQHQGETRPSHHRKERSWPSVRPTYKHFARVQTSSYSNIPTRYETRTRTTSKEVERIEFQIPYAEYPKTSTTTTTLADETLRELSKKWFRNQHTTPLPAQGSAIKISHGRQGPISIVIEDKETEEIQRPIPQAFFLQKPQTTHRIDPRIIVVDNRHIETPSTRASYWEKELKTELIKKILRERETTKKINTTTIGRKNVRDSDDKQGNDGDSESKRFPNVQLVFLNVPQLETKENKKQILRETDKTKEEEKRNEIELKREENKKEQRKREEEQKRHELENRIKEERKQEEERRQEEEKKHEQEKKKEEERRREEEKRKEELMVQEEEKRREQKRIQEEKIKEERKLAEEKRIEEELKREKKIRMEEEIRKELERVEKEKKVLRQKIEKDIKEKEIFDRKWENDLENKIKEKQKDYAIAPLQEPDKKNEGLEKKSLLIQEKINKVFELPLRLKHANEIQKTQPTQNTPSTTLNYWERQWQQDQDTKLREEYNKYMKLHNAGHGLNEKTINYWNDQWRVDLEKKIREKQKEEYERTKTTYGNKWFNTEVSTYFYNVQGVTTDREPALMEMVKKPAYVITDAFRDITEEQENLHTEQNNPVHYNFRTKGNIHQKHIGNGRSMLEDIIIRSSAKSKPKQFDARRDDDYSDTIYIMPDGRKRDKLIIKRVHDRSNRVTTIENMSEEHTAKKSYTNKINYELNISDNNERTGKNHNKNKHNDDVVKSHKIIQEKKIGRLIPKLSKSKKVTTIRDKTEEETEKNVIEKSSDTILSENDIKSENDKTESEAVKESNENLLRMKKSDKSKSTHKKHKDTSEENNEDEIRNKNNKKKVYKTNKHVKRNKKKIEHEIKRVKKAQKGKREKSKDYETEENLTKENEKFEGNHKEVMKKKRYLKQSKKDESEDEQETDDTHKTKHRKPKNKKNKQEAVTEEELDRNQKKAKEKEEDLPKTKLRKQKKENSKDNKEDENETKLQKQPKEERKIKHKKKEKQLPKIQKFKKKKTKHRKGEKEEEAHEDESYEKVSAPKKEDRKAKNKKKTSLKEDLRQKKEQDKKINDEGDGERELVAHADKSNKKVTTHKKEHRKAKNKKEIIIKQDLRQKKEHDSKINDEGDKSTENIVVHEKKDKIEKKKEKSNKGKSHQIKKQERKIDDNDDGGREFDFQLLFGDKAQDN